MHPCARDARHMQSVVPSVEAGCPKSTDAALRVSHGRLSGWADGALRVYDVASWTLEHTLAAHSGPILSIAVVGDRVIRCDVLCCCIGGGMGDPCGAMGRCGVEFE